MIVLHHYFLDALYIHKRTLDVVKEDAKKILKKKLFGYILVNNSKPPVLRFLFCFLDTFALIDAAVVFFINVYLQSNHQIV